MSRQMNYRNNNANTNAKFNSNAMKHTPKCAMCEKAGLTGKALEHYTRETQDPNSKIICPTILAFSCGYCGQAGHSRGFCQALKADQARAERERVRQEHEEERRRNERRSEDERQRQETTRRLNSNIYTAFDDEEEKERAEELKAQLALQAEQARIQAEEAAFPSLSKKPVKQQAPVFHFALVAKNAAHLPIPKPKAKPVVEEEPVYYEEDSDYEEDDYTVYVPDHSFGVAADPYERPAHAAKYSSEEHELEQQPIKVSSNVAFQFVKSASQPKPQLSSYDDCDW